MSLSKTDPLVVGVIGPAGFGGSYLCLELINRGHLVVGISRNPEKLGSHERYSTRKGDVSKLSIEQLAKAFQGLNVLVNEYGPHSAGVDALQYMPFLEVTRRIILATKAAKVKYFIMVGGCGSLFMPNNGYQSVLENKDWWIAYRRGIADSEAHTSYMEARLGAIGDKLRAYRNARKAEVTGHKTPETMQVIDRYEEEVKTNDRALQFITGCRTSFMFFDGNTSFRWTFVSPSALYRPGKRTGKYEVRFDYLALKGDENDPTNLDGRLHGISAADLAVAIADEAEEPRKIGRHWTAYGDLSDDTPTPSYVTLDSSQSVGSDL
ncbi:nad-dependent epimerase dehydratase [Phlyctema vagabunda]|uniref:Nad-dependent epimerase dehydratase n=1 Tax=Phlyctema vagabunda TaxID=108571 RepID=A0ABR4PTL2_9HELO